MPLPSLSPEQRAAALQKAAEVRKARADLKEQLKNGQVTLAQLLDKAESDDVIGKLKVVTVLQALPGIGKVKAMRGVVYNWRLDMPANQGLEDGLQYGMLARIKENIPGKVVAIEHYGVIDKGQEVTSGEAVAEWKGAQENYYFREEDGGTVLTVVTDTTKEYESHMEEAWQKALARLKEICES